MKMINTLFFAFVIFFCSADLFAQTATDLNCTSCVQTAEIQSNAVVSAKIKNNAVTSIKISDDTIKNADISGIAAIDPSKISGTAWTSANDGSGSSLEADLLDGLEGAQFLRSDVSGTISGDLTITGNLSGTGVCMGADCRSTWPAEGEASAWEEGESSISYSSGNVGIGTTSPVQTLHVAGGAIALSRDSTSFSGMYILGEDNPDDRTMQFRNSSSEPTGGWSFYANDSSFNAIRMKINNDGNVGIGTTSPQTPLDVNGVISLEGQKFLQLDEDTFSIGDLAGGDGTVGNLHLRTNDENRLTIDGNGNVGIGTTSPQTSLDVNGVISLGGQKFLQLDEDAFSIGDLAGGDGTVSTLHLRTNDENRLTIDGNGNVGIGTSNPGYELVVEGTIGARELIITNNSLSADFVFKDDYKLKPLAEVESFIQQNKHLPDIPSEKEVLENGVSVGEMQKRLLQKVEELTLYVIAQDKKIIEQDEKIAELERGGK